MSEPFQAGLTIAAINLVGMLLIYSVMAFALTGSPGAIAGWPPSS